MAKITDFEEVSINFENTETSTKRHNTAETSRETFIALTNEGRLIDQKKAIHEAIAHNQPVTSRRLSLITKHERSSVCRSLYDLLNEINPAIKVCFINRCEITNRKVKHYSLINWKPEEGKQLTIL